MYGSKGVPPPLPPPPPPTTTSPSSQGRRRNRYRPSCLIRGFLKAASTDTAQTTSTENQLSGFLFSFICYPFFFIVSCMKEYESTKLETLVVKQKNNGTICVSMLIITYSRKPQVNDFHIVISHSKVASWTAWCVFTCSELNSLILPRSRSRTSQCVWWCHYSGMNNNTAYFRMLVDINQVWQNCHISFT